MELNFTMTVDPSRQQLPGLGDTDNIVVLMPVCEQNVIDGFPAAAGDLTKCGEPINLVVKTSSPGINYYFSRVFYLNHNVNHMHV